MTDTVEIPIIHGIMYNRLSGIHGIIILPIYYYAPCEGLKSISVAGRVRDKRHRFDCISEYLVEGSQNDDKHDVSSTVQRANVLQY